MKRSRSIRRTKTGTMIWTALEFPDANLTVATIGANVVDNSDWSAVGGFERGAVLQRIRGSYGIGTSHTATVSQVIDVAILRLADGESIPDIKSATTLVEEDVLWYRRHYLRAAAQTAVGYSGFITSWELDCKSKRKLDGNTSIVFAIATSSVGGVAPSATAMIRGLVSVP